MLLHLVQCVKSVIENTKFRRRVTDKQFPRRHHFSDGTQTRPSLTMFANVFAADIILWGISDSGFKYILII